jgi:hypothetical protein
MLQENSVFLEHASLEAMNVGITRMAAPLRFRFTEAAI